MTAQGNALRAMYNRQVQPCKGVRSREIYGYTLASISVSTHTWITKQPSQNGTALNRLPPSSRNQLYPLYVYAAASGIRLALVIAQVTLPLQVVVLGLFELHVVNRIHVMDRDIA